MKLEVVIFKKLAEYDLDVCFESHEDRLGLMGPSGSGKSMVLKCIAGIITPDAGRIVLDDEVLFDSNLKIVLDFKLDYSQLCIFRFNNHLKYLYWYYNITKQKFQF